MRVCNTCVNDMRANVQRQKAEAEAASKRAAIQKDEIVQPVQAEVCGRNLKLSIVRSNMPLTGRTGHADATFIVSF